MLSIDHKLASFFKFMLDSVLRYGIYYFNRALGGITWLSISLFPIRNDLIGGPLFRNKHVYIDFLGLCPEAQIDDYTKTIQFYKRRFIIWKGKHHDASEIRSRTR